jgi:hypothetical protein
LLRIGTGQEDRVVVGERPETQPRNISMATMLVVATGWPLAQVTSLTAA